MSIQNEWTVFSCEIQKSQELIVTANKADVDGIFIFNVDQRRMITETALLKIFIAWETFLQNSFLGYMVGDLSMSGNKIAVFANPIDMDHANRMVTGSQRFYDWSHWENLLLSSEIYFQDGEPFKESIRSIQGYLDELKILRNSTAHLAIPTQKKLNDLITRILGVPTTSGCVAEFLLQERPRAQGKTNFEYYIEHLLAAAFKISNT